MNHPKYIIIDFEKAIQNVLMLIFYKSQVIGCIFHFGQWYEEKYTLKNFLLDTKLKRNHKYFQKVFESFFFPKRKNNWRVQRAYWINQFNGYSKNIRKIFENFSQYFEKMFIGNIEKPSNYNQSFWSCYERIKHDYPRTTNNLEACIMVWNRR